MEFPMKVSLYQFSREVFLVAVAAAPLLHFILFTMHVVTLTLMILKDNAILSMLSNPTSLPLAVATLPV